MISVSFSEGVEEVDRSGKHRFLHRLHRAMLKTGRVKFRPDRTDIYLRIPGTKTNKKCKINILRLDGLIINKAQDYRSINGKIVDAIDDSDAIIYQNEFCQLAYEKFLGVKKKPYRCILNGADPNEFHRRQPGGYILANCKWRPHKRLQSIIRSFLIAVEMGLKGDLMVTGSSDISVEHPRIKYLGWKNKDGIAELLSKATCSMHLSWVDWCPNAMVESIVAGCPVVYSNSGGHKYVAGSTGWEIKDTEWDFSPCDYYNPPEIDCEEVAKCMIMSENQETALNSDHLHISKIANKYIDFFESLLNAN